MKRAYRKKAFPLTEIRRFLEPGPIVLVSSAWNGASNVMTMGWHMMLGFSPALFGCYIWDENHSYDMLRRSRQCVISVTLNVTNAIDTSPAQERPRRLLGGRDEFGFLPLAPAQSMAEIAAKGDDGTVTTTRRNVRIAVGLGTCRN
jgi:flavin reductase (DIM6/NTAB) family NADH-FMN oxidoreductase RutF